MGDKLNPNEYMVYEKGNVPYSTYAVKYELKSGTATFWYWRKNLNGRYELVSYSIKDVEKVFLTIDGQTP